MWNNQLCIVYIIATLSVRMCICVCVCMDTHMYAGVNTSVYAWTSSGIPQGAIHLVFELVIDLELIDWVSLPGQKTLGICLDPPL